MNNHTHPHAAINDSEPTTIKSAAVESKATKPDNTANKKLISSSSNCLEPLTQHSGIALPMLVNNVDTDQIIPSREMKKYLRLDYQMDCSPVNVICRTKNRVQTIRDWLTQISF